MADSRSNRAFSISLSATPALVARRASSRSSGPRLSSASSRWFRTCRRRCARNSRSAPVSGTRRGRRSSTLASPTAGTAHEMAVDLANNPAALDWIGQHPEYGLGFPLRYMGPKEYNHMEMIDPASGQRVAMNYAASGDAGF